MRQWLVDIRMEKRMTQEDVAIRSGIARTTYAMIEQGNRDPSVPVAKRIAGVLGFDWPIFYSDQCHETCTNKTGTQAVETA